MCVVEQFVQPVVVVVVLGIANLSAIFIYATIISKGRKLIELRVLRIDVDPNFVVLACPRPSSLAQWYDTLLTDSLYCTINRRPVAEIVRSSGPSLSLRNSEYLERDVACAYFGLPG